MTCTRVTVRQALRFGPRKSRFLDQNTLSLVTAAGAAPLEDNGGQRRVLSGPTRQRGVPRWQEDEVVEVSAGQAKGAAFPGKADPCVASQLLATLVASGFTGRDEYLQVLRFMHGRIGMTLPLVAGRPCHLWAADSALSDACCAAEAVRQASDR